VTASLSEDREGCIHSFIPLYCNIADGLKSPNRFQKAILHLEHEDYREAKDLLQQIESRSNIHNAKVSNFMGSVKQKIIKVAFSEDVFFGISSEIGEYTDPKQNEGYSMYSILRHYGQEAQGIHSNLRINKEEGTSKFRLHREDDNSHTIAISIDEKRLQRIQEKLCGELQIDIVSSLQDFMKEGNDICYLFNDRFVSKIKNIITDFEDEGELKGGCGLSYCPRK
jgi:hypothetical protein